MVGKKIQGRLKALNMTPSELGRRSGVSISTVFNYLKDKVEPTASNLKKIADVLCCTIDWFYADPFADLHDPKLVAMFEKVGVLTEDEKQSVVDFIEFVRLQKKEKKEKEGKK